MNRQVIAVARGGPEVLEIVESPIPQPARGKVRIRILATGVSLADLLMREGVHPETPRGPITLGSDLAGVVDELLAGGSVAGKIVLMSGEQAALKLTASETHRQASRRVRCCIDKGTGPKMTNSLLVLLGTAIVVVWGVAHIAIPTRNIIEGFGPLSADNRRILLMEWPMEGVLLVFIGLLVALVRILSTEGEIAATIVYLLSSLVLLVMAGISAATGARTSIGPMRMRPIIFVFCAVLFLLPAML